MTQKRILILGAGIMQQPAITAAKRMGLHVIVADGNPHAHARALADQFEHVDLRDADGMVAMAQRHQRGGGLDAVFTAGTDFSATVAHVAEALGLPGTSLESARNATDKDRMRAVLQSAGVPVPRFHSVSSTDQDAIAAAETAVGYPAVVKPVDNMGARGVVRVNSRQALTGAVGRALSQSRGGRAIVEQYVTGPEFSIDALVADDEVHITGFADRHITFEPFFIEVGHTIPTALPESDQFRVLLAFRTAVLALGIRNGAAKGDVKLSPDGPVIGEVAARLSGGFMSGWTYPMSSGVDLTYQAIRLSLGIRALELHPSRAWTAAERALISIPGVVRRLVAPTELLSQDEHWVAHVRSGDAVVFPESNVEKCGNVLTSAPDRATAVERAERFIADTIVELDGLSPATIAFLRNPPHRAFELSNSANVDWVANLGPPRWDTLGSPVRASRPLAVGHLPQQATEHHRSWCYRTLPAVVDRISQSGLIRHDRLDRPIASVFWNGLLAGGLQAAAALVERLTGAAPLR